MNNTYHFNTYHTATRFHYARELDKRGWDKTDLETADFCEKNLTLNDEIAKHFEYKHLLAELLQAAKVDFFPLSYSINDNNYSQVLSKITLKHYMINNVYHENVKDLKWILKPATLNNGDDIILFDNVEGLKKHFKSNNRLGGDHIIQRYVQNPSLYQGRKYTYRVWAIFTNCMGIYLYKQGYANVSAHQYNLEDGFKNRKIHITNYVLDGEMAYIDQFLADELPKFNNVYQQMFEIVKQCAKILLTKYPGFLKPTQHNVIEFFGFDFVLDDTGKLWLLEINQSPDCPIEHDENMMPKMWYPFWERIVDAFVLPMSTGIAPKNLEQFFTPVLSKRECYQVWRYLLSRLNILSG